jgi:hypothetical protein
MLETCKVRGAQSISLGDNRDQIHSGAQALHDFNIQRFKGMPRGSDEVKTGMNTEVDLVHTAGLLLLQHVRLMLIIQELYDWHP